MEPTSKSEQAPCPQCCLYTVQMDADATPEQAKLMLQAIMERRTLSVTLKDGNGKEESFVVIGNRAVHGEAVTVSEYFIRLWRIHRLHSNERQTVLSAEDQMVAVQLCLATINKKKIGDFDVEASTVIEMHRSLIADKLQNLPHNCGNAVASQSDEYTELRTAYDSYLKYCNMVDIIDIYRKIHEEMSCNEELSRDILSSNVIVITKPLGTVENTLMKFLAERRSQVQTTKICMPLVGVTETEKVSVECEDSTLGEALEMCEEMKQSAASVTEMHVKGVILAYIHLLVNSRSELGLARSLNVPDRKLDHNAFTALKREAQGKGLSMYQTATSYIMRLRIGGSAYVRPDNCPLGPHVKGFSEFIDLMHKVQTVLEEEVSPAKAVKRVINIIKTTIKRHKDNVLRPDSVENAGTQLQDHAVLIEASLGSTNVNSPNRPANMGGSVLGRDALRVMRHLLDTHAGTPVMSHSVEILGDTISSQKTPLRFQSLLSKFRSPMEVSPDGKIEKSLTERMIEKMGKKPKVAAVPRYQACYDWAQPLHNVGLENRQISDYVPSKTLVCPAESKMSQPRRILESVLDQENVTVAVVPETRDAVSSSKFSQGENLQDNSKSKSSKRPAGQENSLSAPPQKKSKPAPKAAKQNKKKNMPLQKGQKQLTSFFRM